jgi:hypothetical protein
MKSPNSKRLKYLVYMISVIVLILAFFNTYFTIQIHKRLVQAVSKPGRWPVGAYIYDPVIGFDFAPNISGPINDGHFYVKSHQFGYRISENEDAVSCQSGGVLSLGCSFTYGDEVEADQTFTQIMADSLDIPAYNYGICSFSYIHALLKAQELKDQGILDKLKPEYVILGCWSGLLDRSRSPFPPLASKSLSLPAAYLTKDGSDLRIKYPPQTGSIFALLELYRKEGTTLSLKRFVKIFTSVPRYIYLFLKNNRLTKKIKDRTFPSNVSDYEVYDFYFSGIESVFSDYNSRIIVLFMPNKQNEQPDSALKKAIANHPGIVLVDGMEAINNYQVPVQNYKGKHPQPATHLAYAREILYTILTND